MSDIVPSCAICRHLKNQYPLVCKAFPKGIPMPVIDGSIAHITKLPGDNGIRYEPAKAAQSVNQD